MPVFSLISGYFVRPKRATSALLVLLLSLVAAFAQPAATEARPHAVAKKQAGKKPAAKKPAAKKPVAKPAPAKRSPPRPAKADADALPAAPAASQPVASGSDPALAGELGRLLSKGLGRTVVAGLIVDAQNGAVVMDLQAQRPMYPASVAKLFSTAAAARTFGADHVLTTEVRSAPIQNGAVAWLAVVGSGDPSMSARDWGTLAAAVQAAGIHKVGRLIIDGGVFDDRLPAGFDEKQTDAAYRAPIGGLQCSSGAVSVQVTPGAVGAPPLVSLLPDAGEAIAVVNLAQTVAGKGDALSVVTKPLGRRTEVRVTGTISTKRKVVGSGARRVADGTYFAAGVFRQALGRHGVTIQGETQFGRADAGLVVASRVSPAMRQLLAHTNKHSHNGYAETLFKLVGAKRGGMPATNELAQQSVRKALDGLAIRWDKVRLGNGSGLYHADQVTCEAVVDLLRSMATDPAGPVWRDSLPIGGRDGTLRGRQHSFAGKVRAKTGTLDDVSGLAGYAESGDRRYYFAFFFNNLRGGPGPVRAAQDRTLQRLLQ